MRGIDPIAQGDVEFVASGRVGMPEIEPPVPVLPRWNLARELERQ